MIPKKERVNSKIDKNIFRRIIKNPALMILSLIVVLVVALLGTYAYIYRGKNVYAYINKTPIYNYEMSNEIVEQAYKNNVNLGSIGSSPKDAFVKYTLTNFAKRALISRRFYYLMGIKDHFECSTDELDKALYNFKKETIGNSASPEQDFKKELNLRGISNSNLLQILKEKTIAQKEMDKLTSNITATPEEVKKYYDEWSYAYVKNGKNEDVVFKEKYNQIRNDTLDMKKQEYLRKYTNNLIEKNKDNIILDNRYKKFMRWVYGSLLNLSVPSQFEPGKL